MSEEKQTRKGRTLIGEVRGKEQRRNFSHRAMKGNLDVIEKPCPYCGHHKALKTFAGILKCSKCKKYNKLK